MEFSAQSVAVSNTGNGRHVEGVLESLREYELAGYRATSTTTPTEHTPLFCMGSSQNTLVCNVLHTRVSNTASRVASPFLRPRGSYAARWNGLDQYYSIVL